jgi:Histidine phosphatase superfamily (branch 1)
MKTTKKEWPNWPILVVLTLIVTLNPNGSKANAQEAVFVVPRAERKLDRPELTDEGRRKAEALARMLTDANIDAIYAIDTSGRGPAVQTAEPTAKALKMKVNKIPRNPSAIDDWIHSLPTEHAKQRVLLVTVGPGTMPGEGLRFLKGLGVPDQEIWARRSDHLMVILPKDSEEPLVIKMRW